MEIWTTTGSRIARCLTLTALGASIACGGDGPTEPEEPVDCSDISTQPIITVGQTVNGGLTSTDCQLGDGSSADLYRLTLTAPRSVQIDMTSTAVDAYLVLFDVAGTPLDEDDDGGGGSNARIVISLAAGTYVIAANSWEAGETGSYQLRVQ
jgi:hypothetical protein